MGLASLGCASDFNDTPIYTNSDRVYTKSYESTLPNRQDFEPNPLYRQEYETAEPQDYVIKRRARKRNSMDDYVDSDDIDNQDYALRRLKLEMQADDTLIVGEPYTVMGKTFVPRHQPNYHEIGIASWSGKESQGHSTALGEPFDRYSLTGAHPTLPLNAMVKVTNLSNGKSLVIRINDRGPFSSTRILNMTEYAAYELGFRKSGLAKVRVQYVGAAPIPKTAMKLSH